MSIGDVIVCGDVFTHTLLDSESCGSVLWALFGGVDVTKEVSGNHVVAVHLGQSIEFWATDNRIDSEFSPFLVDEF
jgi:hypothetical protein